MGKCNNCGAETGCGNNFCFKCEEEYLEELEDN